VIVAAREGSTRKPKFRSVGAPVGMTLSSGLRDGVSSDAVTREDADD